MKGTAMAKRFARTYPNLTYSNKNYKKKNTPEETDNAKLCEKKVRAELQLQKIR